MNLRDWLHTNRVTYKAFGESIGLHPSQVCRLANRQRVPTLRQAVDIRAATQGDVEIDEWVE
jgi:DNA-binding transcriptional regulator YdaS (Cro superfamily)